MRKHDGFHQVRLARLRLLHRLLCIASPALISVSDASVVTKNSFALYLIDDFAWLALHPEVCKQFADPTINMLG